MSAVPRACLLLCCSIMLGSLAPARQVAAQCYPGLGDCSPSPRLTYYEGIDFYGDDISDWMSGYSLSGCGEACRANSACKAFTFNTAKRVCILKKGVGKPVNNVNATSGTMDGLKSICRQPAAST